MTVDSEQDEGGVGRNAASRPTGAPHIDLEARSTGRDEEEDEEETETPIGRTSQRSRRMIIDSDEDEIGGGRNAESRARIDLEPDNEARSPATEEEETETEDEEETETEDEEETETEDEEETETEDEVVVTATAPTSDEVERLRQVELSQALERLENMCLVLGVNYKKKLLEMGVTSIEDVEIERVREQMEFLQITIDSNYEKLKTTGKDLLKEWELCNTPFKKMMAFAHVISVSDSTTSADVVDAEFLSTLNVKKAKDELTKLKKEREKSEKTEYLNEREKLKDLVNENHLTWADVGFDPKKTVVPASYRQVTNEIRKGIAKARELSVGRKEMVFRVELVRQLIHQKGLPPQIIRGHLASAEIHVKKITSGLLVVYDGEEVTAILRKLRKDIDDLKRKQKNEEKKSLRMLRIRTRHGRTPPPDPASCMI